MLLSNLVCTFFHWEEIFHTESCQLSRRQFAFSSPGEELRWLSRRLRAQPPVVFRELLGMSGGGGIRRSRIPPRRARQVGVSGVGVAASRSGDRISLPVLEKAPGGGRQPSLAGPGRGVVSAGEEVPGQRGLRHSGAGTAESTRLAVATPGPGAGRRWLPLAQLRAGRCWRRLRPRPGRRRGGGLAGLGR